jgi:hypothetical protein
VKEDEIDWACSMHGKNSYTVSLQSLLRDQDIDRGIHKDSLKKMAVNIPTGSNCANDRVQWLVSVRQ